MRINRLFVIMKLVERCNLNCSYCYYYAPENAEVYSRPVRMSVELLDRLVDYVDQAVDENDIGEVVFAFHGGEPTLAKPDVVRAFCTKLKDKLAGRTIYFAIQTNGMSLSDAWLQLIRDESISVGVSLDGDKESHDQYRVDHRGRGSYDRIRETLEKVKEVASSTQLNLAALTVMEPAFKGLDYYLHMTDELGLRDLKLLFADCTHDNPPGVHDAQRLGRALCSIFDHWLLHDSKRVRIAPFQEAVRNVLKARMRKPSAAKGITIGCSVLSDGRVQISDDFMAPAAWFAAQEKHSIFDSTFADWFAQPHVKESVQAKFEVPTACRECAHADSCRGGEIPHRYSQARGFDNPSVHCVTLKIFYDHITQRLHSGLAEAERMRSEAPAEVA